jgi:hypothetical protein
VPNRHNPAAATIVPPAVVTHTIARICGQQYGDITVYHAATVDARMALIWGGMLMVFYSAQAAQGVLEGFAAARPILTHVVRSSPPVPAAEPGVQQTLSLDWTRRAPYAVVPREELSADKRRVIRWIDIHMGPVTWQILDQEGYKSALDILRLAHKTAVHVFNDGRKFRADPTRDDYTPPQ